MDKKEYYNTCEKCGRPMAYATKPKCNYCNECMGEYCGCKLGRIKEVEPSCDNKAVIPSVTVESVEGITNLANCLVHVEDINTTFYVDDKHRIMITWAGPVNIPGYDLVNNPNHYKNQIVTDIDQKIAVIYDNKGNGFTFAIDQDADFTDAVNAKLDEMAEDGTLGEIVAQYVADNIVFGFDTVADMKASTDLVAGNYARTLGYYTKNGGGDALYYISDDSTLVDNGGSVIALDSGLSAVLLPEKNARLSQFGIDATHNSNINNFIAYVNNNSLVSGIEFDPGVMYSLDLVMAFTKQDLEIIGNGATILLSNTTRRDNLFQISATNSCTIKDLTIDGSAMPQDQWSIQSVSNYSYRRCFYITSPTIQATNIRIKNVWGQGLQLYGYENVDIKDCVFDKIGGDFWYHDADTGAFDFCGDAVYLSGHAKDANVNISNCIFIGYENSDATKNDSRCGIVLENLAGYTMTGLITNLNVSNTIIKNFSRPLHHEAYQSLTHMRFNNCELLKASCFMASNRTYTDLVITNSVITYHNAINYLGSSAFRYMNARIENCDITLSDAIENALGHDSNIVYKDCTINNVIKRLNNGSIKCELIGCTLNFNEGYAATTYLTVGTPMTYRNCVFNKTTQLLSTNVASGQISNIYGCTFNNIFPTFRPIFRDFDSVLDLTTEPGNLTFYTRRIYANGTVRVNDNVVSVPNMGGVLAATETANTDGNTTYTAFNSSTLPIIPATLPANVVLRRNTKYLMIMYGTNDSVFKYNTTFENFYYTDLTFDTSGVGSIGTINTQGAIPANNVLSFDTGAGTVAQSGTLATNYLTWILPYEYKEKLGL